MDLLVQYSESEDEEETMGKQEDRLPLPVFLDQEIKKNCFNEEDEEGRVRNFPHEPGNWSTYVYLPVSPSPKLSNYLKTLKSFFEPLDLKLVDDFHISLTRTVILRHHWIQDFSAIVQNRLRGICCFKILLSGLKVFANEQGTRTFLSLEVLRGNKEVKAIVKQLDACLAEYNLQPFYQDASFHMSLLWCPGNKCGEVNQFIGHLPLKLKSFQLNENVSLCICASGNKKFTFNFC